MTTPVGCGGCRGEGSHRRWCREAVGPRGALLGPLGQRVEGIADEVGGNDPGVANRLYVIAGDLLSRAAEARDTWQAGQ